MSNQEIIITIVTIVLTSLSTVLGFFLNRNEKTKKYYEAYLKVEAKIKELIIIAEENYDTGDKRKKYVISCINVFLEENGINIENKIIDDMIETLISLTKKVNQK